MLNSFFPQQTPDLAHPLFGSIVGLLEFLLFLIESFEVVVFCHNNLGGSVQLASENRDLCFHCFHIRNGFFTRLPSLSCPHAFFLLFLPSCHSLTGFLFLPLVWVVSGVHLFPPMFLAVVVKTVVPAREFSMGPSGPSMTRLLLWGPLLSWVRIDFLSAVVVVGDAWFPRSPGELWVPVSQTVTKQGRLSHD